MSLIARETLNLARLQTSDAKRIEGEVEAG